MKNHYQKYLSDESWVVTENGWEKHLQPTREAQFAQGNGFIGTRGVLEEVPVDAIPGTYMAGLYDRTGVQATELVNLPNPIHFKISTGDNKPGMAGMDIVRHRRQLDLKTGLLTRHTVFQDSKKRRFDYQSARFVSMANENLVVYQVYLTPLDRAADITIHTDVDASVSNQGILSEGRKRHFRMNRMIESDGHSFQCVKTLEKGILIGSAGALMYQIGKKKRVTGAPVLDLHLKKGETVCFTRIVCMGSSADDNPGRIERLMTGVLKKSLRDGFDVLFRDHARAFRKQWDTSDIVVQGSMEIQRALRFNIYHLLICAPRHGGEASIGAKTLSGEGYRGHIFWDTETFMLPFFIYTQPQAAKNMLLYRYERLDAARRIARSQGHRGVQFPWESADTGEECTPAWAKNFDGRPIRVRTGELEHHIVADIAYATFQYYLVTGDQAFMLRYGHEILFEAARFWASRVSFNRRKKTYDIRHVIGPDEFHEDVHNNAYTNLMARWTLSTAQEMVRHLRRRHPMPFRALSRKIGLKEKECRHWGKVAAGIMIHVRNDRIIEQFDGYFRKKWVRNTNIDKNGLPDIPVGFDLRHISKTQFVKQADVVLLFHMFPELFSMDAKRQNYEFYMNRTLHKSSLSPSVHAIVGNDVKDHARAFPMFMIALNEDLENMHGNVKEGIHAANLGGVWQAVVNSFAGVRIIRRKLSISPNLPSRIRGLSLSIKWHGAIIRLVAQRKKLSLKMESPNKTQKIPALIHGRSQTLKSNRRYHFRLS